MLATAKVVTFLATTKPETCRSFYEGALGLKLVADEPATLVYQLKDVMLRIGKVEQFEPLPFTVLGWEVEDLEAVVQDLAAREVPTERFDGIKQDELGIASFGDTTRIAWLKDPDGNILSLAEELRSSLTND